MAGSGLAAPTSGTGGTFDLIARVRDLMAEETADLYGDATEILPSLNEGKDIIFSTCDVLPKTLSQALAGGVATFVVADLGRFDWLCYGANGPELTPIHADEIRNVLGTSGTPRYYSIGLASSGDPQFTLYPTPGATDTTVLVGSYFSVPADLTITGSNPTWHKRFHFLPCYHAAAVMLRKDRRPEASVEMEGRFRAGMVEYSKWYESRFPYRGDTVRSQPSPMGASYTPTYPDEIG